MTKRTSLEEVFNLPPARIEEIEEGMDEIQDYTTEQMNDIMDRADKIDAALPQVKGLDATACALFNRMVTLTAPISGKYKLMPTPWRIDRLLIYYPQHHSLPPEQMKVINSSSQP